MASSICSDGLPEDDAVAKYIGAGRTRSIVTRRKDERRNNVTEFGAERSNEYQ